jgi:glycosyltransferase involved in cell wall biosynthesis
MPKVTVLMPVFNAEKYLREAVESILAQTFTDFEFLIIDDGSTDGSTDIIHSYRDRRIRLISNERNIGIGNTLNKGIELASSGLIARMDADDISLPERLMTQYNFMRARPGCALLSSNVEEIDEDGNHIRYYRKDSRLFYYNLTFYCWIYHPSVMYRREAVRDAGMYPSTFSEDFRLWSRLIKKHPFCNHPEILLKYRITGQSVSNSTFTEEYRQEARKQIIENLKYFAGDDYTIPDDWLEAYRNHIEPLCNPPRVREMADCLRELDVITPHILAKENVNRDPEAILEAAEKKKKHLLHLFLSRIPLRHRLQLLMATGNYRRAAGMLIKGTFNR